MTLPLGLVFHHKGGKEKTEWTPGLSPFLTMKATRLLRPVRPMDQQRQHHMELEKNADSWAPSTHY